ncbi:MAG: cytochrome c oxidase subunit I [Actinobacteria bacterium]|nr:MAG: cytochrome c oxidase subunit I [Actinomycetota bacterium]
MATVIAESVSHRLEKIWDEPPGLGTWLDTVDHKKIGKHYIYTAFLFFTAGGIEAMLLRAQLARPNEHLLNPEAYNQLFSMHGITMIFWFVTPMLFGFGNYFVPLMIGARDMAFPRLNAFGYWIFLFSGIFVYSSFLIGRAPDDGWFNYPTLSNLHYTPGLNIDYYTLGLAFLSVSTTVGSINFIVTIFKLRAPGMSIARMPLYVWSILATSFAVVFALPSLTVANVMLELDRRVGFNFFNVAKGGDVVLWQHLFWIFGHPDVYIIFLPAVGIVSTIIPTFARRRIIGYVWLALATMSIAIIGFGVWVHHMFAVGLPNLSMAFFSAASMLITIPSAVQIFAWIATIISGRPVLKTPMLFILGFIFVFVVGGVTGVMFAAVPFDQQITDSYFVVAHFHYVLFGGAVFPILAAIYYWTPKMFGRLLHEGWGKLSFWLIFLGFNLTFFPMHIAGLLGMPRRVYTYHGGLGWDLWNLLSTIGGYVLAAGLLVVVLNFLWSLRSGARAGPDPWGAQDLEWATSSPPPHYNFLEIPTVRSNSPLWDQPELREMGRRIRDLRRTLAEGHETLATTVVDAEAESVLPMPESTHAPVITAIGITGIFVGFLTLLIPVVAIGALIFVGGLLAWVRPKVRPEGSYA